MGRYDNEWDRDRWDRESDRDRDRSERDWDRDREREERRPQRQAYTGWAGRGFNQGSFGRFGGQGSNLFSKYGGQGFGAQHGYERGSRELGGGMSTYTSRDSDRGYDDSRSERWGSEGGYGQGSEGWNREDDRRDDRSFWSDRDRHENRDRDRQEGGRDWGGQGFSGREGGWGGYGSYDRERGMQDRDRGQDRDRNRERESSTGGTQSRPYGWGGSSSSPATSQDSSRRGQFAGRGPKGWQRSDDRIREDINERLTDHPDIDASEIEVQVTRGEVTLTGEVGDRDTKRLAEDIAERVSGVRDVHNQVRVNRGFWGAIKDAFTGENDDEAHRRDRSGQPESTTGDRASTTPTRMITPDPATTTTTGTAGKDPVGTRK
jgi:osmotically-inducible protein OsmY